MITPPPRVRDVYEQHVRGEVTFERVLEVSEAFLDRWAREHAENRPIDEPLLRMRQQQQQAG